MSNADKCTATIDVCVHCRNINGCHQRQGRQILVYAYGGLSPIVTA